jgi:hypothetical protein
MKEIVHAIFFGIFILILTYLALKNAPGAVSVLNAGGTQLSNESKILQGR